MEQKKRQKSIATIDEAMAFIYKTAWEGSKRGLSRVTELLDLLGNPQKKLKFIHIAGTNGKGSTAAMLASVLKEAGYKTGLYTSPYIHKFGERIQINSSHITDSDLIKLSNILRECAEKMQEAPTVFELITTIALLYFYQNQCDIVVFEVGLGGRLDATNIIDTPEVAVITSIGIDHTTELGDTVEKIAAEKAGIIKQNGVVVCYPQKKSVEAVIREKCLGQNAQVSFVSNGELRRVKQDLTGQKFDCYGIKNLIIPLLGEHQLVNAVVAISTVNALQKRGWSISDNALRNGLKNTFWPGRFEIMRHNPIFIVDGAHNPQGVGAVTKNLRSFFPDKKFLFIVGVLADKNYKEMIDILVPYANRFIVVTPDNPRALPAEEFAPCMNKNDVEIIACKSIEQGVKQAVDMSDKDDIICALGSLYIIGKIRECLQLSE